VLALGLTNGSTKSCIGRVDDHGLDMRLAQFRTLRMSTVELAENFPAKRRDRQLQKANERCRVPKNAPFKRSGAYREKQEKNTGAAERRSHSLQRFRRQEAEMLKLAPDLRMQTLLTMTPEERNDSCPLKGTAREPSCKHVPEQ